MRTGGSGWLARLTRHDAPAVAETITSRSRGSTDPAPTTRSKDVRAGGGRPTATTQRVRALPDVASVVKI
ncbi:MAG: hypothetical protein WBM01_24955 [Mycobacterium sp.]